MFICLAVPGITHYIFKRRSYLPELHIYRRSVLQSPPGGQQGLGMWVRIWLKQIQPSTDCHWNWVFVHEHSMFYFFYSCICLKFSIIKNFTVFSRCFLKLILICFLMCIHWNKQKIGQIRRSQIEMIQKSSFI